MKLRPFRGLSLAAIGAFALSACDHPAPPPPQPQSYNTTILVPAAPPPPPGTQYEGGIVAPTPEAPPRLNDMPRRVTSTRAIPPAPVPYSPDAPPPPRDTLTTTTIIPPPPPPAPPIVITTPTPTLGPDGRPVPGGM